MLNTNLATLLSQRGHEIISEGTSEDILIPKSADTSLTDTFEDILYRLMQSESFRRAFRDWAYDGKVSDKQLRHIEAYLSLGSAFDPSFSDVDNSKSMKILKYSHTFEWYISQLLLREFGARAAGFNIRLRDASPDDDFDCIAIIDNGLVFIECKTGKSALFTEIKKFTRRDEELCASHSFFIFDRDYTFKKGGEDLPDIKKSKAQSIGLDSIDKIMIGKSSLYFIVGNGRCFLTTSGFSNLNVRLRHMLRHTTLYHEGVGLHHKAYKHEPISFADN